MIIKRICGLLVIIFSCFIILTQYSGTSFTKPNPQSKVPPSKFNIPQKINGGIFDAPAAAFTVVGNTIYIDAAIGSPSDYTDLIKRFDACKAGDSYTMYITSPGGNAFTMYEIASSIESSKCITHVHVRGLAASAAAIIAMTGTTVELEPGAILMFHTLQFGGNQDSVAHIQQQLNGMVPTYENWIRNHTKGIFTEEDIQHIMAGDEIWMTKQDFDKRMDKHVIK